MSSHNIFSCESIRKILCRITRKTHLGLAKAGLDSGMVLFSSGLNRVFLLYLHISTQTCIIWVFIRSFFLRPF